MARPLPPRSIRTLCLQWARIGPYHGARLRAAHAWGADRGGRVVALETAGRDETYGWEGAGGAEPYERVCALPDGTAETARPRVVHAAVTEALDRVRPDAVAITSYSTPDAQAALAWCRRHRRPAVCMLASKADDAPRSAVREWAKSALVRQFDAGVGGGTPQADYLVRLGVPRDRVFIPYDVVDNDYFWRGAEAARADPGPVRDRPGLARPGPFFLASNRLVARKNVAMLLDAYARYRAGAERPWPLVLLGDGPDRGALEAHARGLDGVTFAGRQPFGALPAYYGLAGAFVHPSLQDQWGLVVNEAMAAGLPVLVSTRTGAAPDLVVEGDTGYTFAPDDATGLATLLGTVAGWGPERRAEVGRRARARVALWSPERFAEAVWSAADAGLATADRSLSPTAAALLWAHRAVARRGDQFHALRDAR